MEIRTLKLAELLPANYNPRIALRPGDREWKEISDSLEEFGYVETIVWNKRSGNIVGGHQRASILAAQGVEEIQVSVVDLDPTNERRLNLALNKTRGDWDEVKLEALLRELQAQDAVFATGFEHDSIMEMLKAGPTLGDTVTGNAQAGTGRTIADVAPAGQGRSEQSLRSQWLETQLRQIVLIYGPEEFMKVQEGLEKIAGVLGFERNAQVVEHLVTRWMDENA